MGRPFGLDYGAIMTVGAHRGADLSLLAEVLPSVEAAILAMYAAHSEGD